MQSLLIGIVFVHRTVLHEALSLQKNLTKTQNLDSPKYALCELLQNQFVVSEKLVSYRNIRLLLLSSLLLH